MVLAWSILRNKRWLMVLLAARIATIVRRGFEEIIHHHLMTKLMILRVELDISEDILLVTILQSF